MSKRHTVTLKELDDCLNEVVWYRFASHHSNGGSSKIFECNNSGLFRITDHGAVIYLGDDKTAAVAAYNGAP
jgi:hypothetical protein